MSCCSPHRQRRQVWFSPQFQGEGSGLCTTEVGWGGGGQSPREQRSLLSVCVRVEGGYLRQHSHFTHARHPTFCVFRPQPVAYCLIKHTSKRPIHHRRPTPSHVPPSLSCSYRQRRVLRPYTIAQRCPILSTVYNTCIRYTHTSS